MSMGGAFPQEFAMNMRHDNQCGMKCACRGNVGQRISGGTLHQVGSRTDLRKRQLRVYCIVRYPSLDKRILHG